MPVNFGSAASPLGLAALEAQGTPCDIDPDACVTYADYIDKYLIPVAKTDLIYDSICLQSRASSISRVGLTADTSETLDQRSEREFRILVDSKQRGQYAQIVDIVLDCSGLGSARRGLASGGSLACGQQPTIEALLTGKRDVQDQERATFAGKHTLLVGDNLEACANVAEFMALAEQAPNTKLTWIVPKPCIQNGLPITQLYASSQTSFGDAVRTASAALTRRELPIVPVGAWGIERITHADQSWKVLIQSTEDDTLEVTCDNLIDCSHPQSDWRSADAIDPRPYSESMPRVAPEDKPQVEEGTAASPILTHEPHYYVLGNKSTAGSLSAASSFTIPAGLAQIREAFGLIGGRAELDLYSSVKPGG